METANRELQDQLAQRLRQLIERIELANRRSGRLAGEVRLVGASKTQPAQAIRAAYESGLRDFGENYVQEALSKQRELADLTDLRWHLIGHLQTNKARLAAGHFTLFQTLDSPRLAQALARGSGCGGRPAVLIEINLGGETSKAGVPPEQAGPLIEQVRDLVDVRGLMAIPPAGPTPEASRPYFAALRRLRERLASATGLALTELSMGMSEDFVVAIEEGATIVRIGRALFGPRPVKA